MGKRTKTEEKIAQLREKLAALEEDQRHRREIASLEAKIKKVEIDAAAAEQEMSRKRNEPVELKIVSPQQNEEWKIGQIHAITWLSTGLVGDWVRIDLLKRGQLFREIAVTASIKDGLFSWVPPDALPPTTDYKIRLIDHATGIVELSDNFKIAR